MTGEKEVLQDDEQKRLPDDCGLLHDGERIDDLQRDGLRIIQNPAAFCFGMDAVLLSAFAASNVKQNEKNILDLCAGNGVIPLLLSARLPQNEQVKITGLEINEDSADLARRSVALNTLSERISIVTGDVKDAAELFPASSFDLVTANPPYMIGAHGLKNPDEAKNIARHEILCTWEDVVQAAATLVKPKGRFVFVHRPFRLPELLTTLVAANLEPKRMRLVYPFLDAEPNMVLIEAVRGGNPRLKTDPPFVIYEREGVYTEEVRRLYED